MVPTEEVHQHSKKDCQSGKRADDPEQAPHHLKNQPSEAIRLDDSVIRYSDHKEQE
jgi:hypothetical protein